jgi:uncharacterized protein YjbJ (UPF0337 family)
MGLTGMYIMVTEGKENIMNRDIMEGNWKQLRGHIKEWWGTSTDDELDQIDGQYDRFVGKLQEKYGYTQEEAEDAVSRFLDRVEYRMDDNTVMDDTTG